VEKKNLEFCFKGSRTYVHGTDIFNVIMDKYNTSLHEHTKIDLSFHGISRKNISLSLIKPKFENDIKFAYKYNDKYFNRNVLYGIENNEEIECRYEYPEENIYNLSSLDLNKQEIFLNKDTSFTFIENIVAMNKYLLEKLFTNQKGKWYFTRLQIDKRPLSSYPIRLKFRANFNFKLTKTEIYIDEVSVGFIYFSLV
jgi:hypothetical protein